jgi:prepilin-type N-terminal cleavage/methylation domain-containing protein
MKFSFQRTPLKGFTLIELLIVVAIIAILAAIAVPNFLEAQTRSKVSRARADIRSVATALESYQVDNNRYPPTPYVDLAFDGGVMRVIPNLLSTPVAYISSANLLDPFITQLDAFQGIQRDGTVATYADDPAFPLDPGAGPLDGQRYYYNSNRDGRRSGGTNAAWQVAARQIEGDWIVMSLGPDEQRNLINVTIPGGTTYDTFMPYDPTNGTISDGDIIRTQKKSEGTL